MILVLFVLFFFSGSCIFSTFEPLEIFSTLIVSSCFSSFSYHLSHCLPLIVFPFPDLVLTNMGGDPTNSLNISSHVSDISSRTKIVDPEIPNIAFLVVNRSIANLVFLNDILGSSRELYQRWQ